MEMVRLGQKEKAAQLIDKMFEGFPNMNFPYGSQTMYFLDAYIQAGAYDKAKKHINILADNLAANLKFYNSLPQEDRMGTFGQDYQSDMQTKDQLIALVTRAGDLALKDELEKKFGAYQIQPGLK